MDDPDPTSPEAQRQSDPAESIFADLTKRQLQCLSLVSYGLTSKEIARLLSLQSGSVDGYLKQAARRTGVSDRRRLARLFAQQRPDLHQSTLQRLGLSEKALVSATSATPTGEAGTIEPPPPSPRAWPVPTAGRPWNDLKVWQKRVWATAIAFGALASLALLVEVSRRILLMKASMPH